MASAFWCLEVSLKDHTQRPELPFTGFRRLYTFRDLNIKFIVWLLCYTEKPEKVNCFGTISRKLHKIIKFST